MKKNLLLYMTLASILFLLPSPLTAQVSIETSAVSIFWEVVDTLGQDKQPSDALWSKFTNHPAYVQIEKSGNRVTYLKRVLPIVFKPSQSEKLKEVLLGKETITQYFATHLQEIKIKRQELISYLDSGLIDSYKDSYTKSLTYLPSDVEEDNINLVIYIALFEDNGFGGKVITMDLLHLMNGTDKENMDFFGHEFHHALRNKSKTYTLFEPEDSLQVPLFAALNKLPLEGVASMIDKRKYFKEDYYTNTEGMSATQHETVIEFQTLVQNANENLEQIDLVLSGNLPYKEKGKEIFKHLPWSGHAIGFYLANTIEQSFGTEKLIEVQYSSVYFLLTYQKASKINPSLYTFSDKTEAFLASLK